MIFIHNFILLYFFFILIYLNFGLHCSSSKRFWNYLQADISLISGLLCCFSFLMDLKNTNNLLTFCSFIRMDFTFSSSWWTCFFMRVVSQLDWNWNYKQGMIRLWNRLECSLSLVIILLLTGTFSDLVPSLAGRLDQVIRWTYPYKEVLR